MSQNRETTSGFAHLFSLTYPIFLGYVSVGAVFGVVARSAGLSFWFAVLSSVFLYAGAAQFLLVRLVQVATPSIEVFLAVLLLNIRHAFYFKPVAKKLPVDSAKRAYSLFALTDESFAVLSDSHVTAKDGFGVVLLNHCYWILGTAIGAGLGGWVAGRVTGLDFALLALFIVLLMEKIRLPNDFPLLAICLSVCSLVWLALPVEFFLLGSMFVCLASVIVLDRKTHA